MFFYVTEISRSAVAGVLLCRLVLLCIKVFQLHSSTEHFIFTPPSPPHRDPIHCIFKLNSNSKFSANSRLQGTSKATYNIHLHNNKTDCRSDQFLCTIWIRDNIVTSCKRIFTRSNIQDIKCTRLYKIHTSQFARNLAWITRAIRDL